MSKNKWSEVKEVLQTRLDEPIYNKHFNGSQADLGSSGLIISLPAGSSAGMVKHQLHRTVKDAIKPIFGNVEIHYRKQSESEPIAETESKDDYDLAGEGVYHDRRNAIIKPDKLDWNTKYFRKSWRPLLGPLLSELIRELRQRCYHSKDDPSQSRNHFKTTYKSLAQSLGVTERTIQRALAKNSNGQFKNELLNHFIVSMTTLKESHGKGSIRNKGSKFIIYLDEPLTPKDQVNFS